MNLLPHLFANAMASWSKHNVLRLSAALAYYSVFSITPLLIIAMSVAGWIFGHDAVRGQLDDQLRTVMGSVPAKAVQSLVLSTSEPSAGLWAAIIGGVTLLIGASTVFAEIKEALNRIWEVPVSASTGLRASVQNFVMARLLSFGMVLAIGFLLLISLILTTILAAVGKYSFTLLPLQLVTSAGIMVALAIETTLFALIFKVLPDVSVQWKHAVRGAFGTAILFEIGKWVLGLYLGRESVTSGFGAAGSLVLILLWVYYTSLILYTGAAFTHAYAFVDQKSVPAL